MQKSSEMSYRAMISLLWSQYKNLPEPLKEGFINLAQSVAKETEKQNIKSQIVNGEIQDIQDNDLLT
jgi:hypothetical protein